jgi:calcineurin-like phosphoesterase family protein
MTNVPSNVFVTADHHFGHANIIKFCGRPFADVREMDRVLVERWNAVVGPEDVVYHLGDFTLTGSLSPWLERLQFGQLYFVPGGHDHRWLRRFEGQAEEGRWIEVLPPLVSLEFPSGRKRPHVVVLCHYPMLSWDRSHYGSLHLHGHSHGTIPDSPSGDEQLPPGERKGRRIDVGVDRWDFAPVPLARLLEGA